MIRRIRRMHPECHTLNMITTSFRLESGDAWRDEFEVRRSTNAPTVPIDCDDIIPSELNSILKPDRLEFRTFSEVHFSVCWKICDDEVHTLLVSETAVVKAAHWGAICYDDEKCD